MSISIFFLLFFALNIPGPWSWGRGLTFRIEQTFHIVEEHNIEVFHFVRQPSQLKLKQEHLHVTEPHRQEHGKQQHILSALSVKTQSSRSGRQFASLLFGSLLGVSPSLDQCQQVSCSGIYGHFTCLKTMTAALVPRGMTALRVRCPAGSVYSTVSPFCSLMHASRNRPE